MKLEDQILVEFRRMQYTSMRKKRIGIFHVSDYVRACQRNSYYAHLKDANHDMDTTHLGYVWPGEAIHQMLDRSAQPTFGEQPLIYNFVDDCKVDHIDSAWTVQDWLKILVGERDAIYMADGKPVLIDYKTIQSKEYKLRSMKDEHRTQLNMYRYLMAKSLDMDVQRGAIIYLDFNDRLAKPLIFTTVLDPLEKTRAELLEKYTTLKECHDTGMLPERKIGWLCNFCPYASRCFTEEHITNRELEIVK